MPLCDEIADVPDAYKPACYSRSSDTLLYAIQLPDGSSTSSNYPSSTAVEYIPAADATQ